MEVDGVAGPARPHTPAERALHARVLEGRSPRGPPTTAGREETAQGSEQSRLIEQLVQQKQQELQQQAEVQRMQQREAERAARKGKKSRNRRLEENEKRLDDDLDDILQAVDALDRDIAHMGNIHLPGSSQPKAPALAKAPSTPEPPMFLPTMGSPIVLKNSPVPMASPVLGTP